MSHYAVLVMTDKNTRLDELMAPFDENLAVEKYIRYSKEELVQREREDLKYWYENQYQEYLKDPEEFNKRENEWIRNFIPDELLKRMKMSDEELFEKVIATDDETKKYLDDEGNYWSEYNPDSKWDYYSIGGRWNSAFKINEIAIEREKIKNGGKLGRAVEFDSPNGELDYYWYKDGKGYMSGGEGAYAKDIDFSPNKAEYDGAVRFWELLVEGREPADEDEKMLKNIYNPEYYVKMYGTKENYAESCAKFTTYAVVTPDGEWHEPGPMGWFGVSHATIEEQNDFYGAFDSFIKQAIENDWFLTIVDCHI